MRELSCGIMIVMFAAVGGCENKPSKPPESEVVVPVNTNDVAIIETKQGKMVVEFFHKEAPKTVANFQKLARKNFYDGTTFHRIMKGFMIQGGDPLSKDPKNLDLGSGSPGYSIKAEFNNQPHRLGTLSMARSTHPDSAGCQFFICLNRCADLDGEYTAFGKLIAGEDVLRKIGDSPTKMDRRGEEKSVPEERVVIEKITIVPREEALK
jgi:peptidyl-prolyl cis-trans isomerase B (cyclophilin B)